MSETSKWKNAILPLGIAALALALGIESYIELEATSRDGSIIAYVFEIGLPGLIFVLAFWQGIALWQSNGESA